MRSDKALRTAFRRLQLPTTDDPKAVVATVVPAIPASIRTGWDELEGDDGARVAYAFAHPEFAHLLTVGVTLPTFREELEWILGQFDSALPDGAVLDIGAGSGVAAAILTLATSRTVTACEPATGAADAISHVAATVGVEVKTISEPVSKLASGALGDTGVALAQSILSYLGFGFEAGQAEQENQRKALVHVLSAIGEALVVEHVLNADDQTSTWESFISRMADSGMYPVWETASFASGYSVFTPDVPAHERIEYKRPKLCLRFSQSGDPRDIEARLEQLLGEPREGSAWLR